MSKLTPILTGEVRDGKVIFYDKAEYQMWVDSLDGKQVDVIITRHKEQRTNQQNKSIHLYCEQVAEALNDAGLTIEKVIKNFTQEHDWTRDSVKELLWRTAQKAALGKYSTTELDKRGEIDMVWEQVNRFLAKLGVESIPLPSKESEQASVIAKVEQELRESKY